VLLRGVNVGSANRIKMPALREALVDAGFSEVETYVQSGNIVLESELAEAAVAEAVSGVLHNRFEIQSRSLVRGAEELAQIIACNPFPEYAAANPKLYYVTFLSEPAEPARLSALQERAVGEEKVVAVGRELYSWHPQGSARSKLALGLVPKATAATSRNWTTVTALHDLTRSAT
jgi:uncharacterized protein (DUF1697 family)